MFGLLKGSKPCSGETVPPRLGPTKAELCVTAAERLTDIR